MAGGTVITVVGNLTADPELRTIGSGAAVASSTIASTPRTWNRKSNQFEDGQALFMRCSAWRDMAEHCAQSLSKGMRVIAQGRLQQRSYQAQDGSQRTVIEMQVDEIGPVPALRDRPGDPQVVQSTVASAAIAAATTVPAPTAATGGQRRLCRWSGRCRAMLVALDIRVESAAPANAAPAPCGLTRGIGSGASDASALPSRSAVPPNLAATATNRNSDPTPQYRS